MQYRRTVSGAVQSEAQAAGLTVMFQAANVRKEHTGIHALVTIAFARAVEMALCIAGAADEPASWHAFESRTAALARLAEMDDIQLYTQHASDFWESKYHETFTRAAELEARLAEMSQ